MDLGERFAVYLTLVTIFFSILGFFKIKSK